MGGRCPLSGAAIALPQRGRRGGGFGSSVRGRRGRGFGSSLRGRRGGSGSGSAVSERGQRRKDTGAAAGRSRCGAVPLAGAGEAVSEVVLGVRAPRG